MRLRKTRRPRADWVFRGNIHDVTGALVEDLGTYVSSTTDLTAGEGNALGKILYDSHNYIKSAIVSAGAPGSSYTFASSARAEGGRARIHRVRGSVFVRPTTWTIGSFFRLGFRFGMFEQDAVAGTILVDPLYNMWLATNATDNAPSRWANDRAWQHERREFKVFATGNETVGWNFRFNFPVNRSLRPDQCYAVYMETIVSSATLQVQRWLSTLVSDEG